MREDDGLWGNTPLGCSLLTSLCLVSADDVVILVLYIGVINDAWDLAEVGGNTVAPPELSGDTPVLNLLEPVKPCAFVLLGYDLQFLGAYGIA